MAWGLITLATLFGAYPLLDSPTRHIREFGLGAFEPLHANRDLRLVNAQAMLLEKEPEGSPLRLRLGITASAARGHIRQGIGNDAPDLVSNAQGLGVTAEARLRLVSAGPLSLNLTLGATPMVHDRGFPAGGTRWNGMFEAGPSLAWRDAAGGHWTVGARWLHLSNGKGLTPENPSYEGRGVALRWQAPL
jgi:hypothetical protein